MTPVPGRSHITPPLSVSFLLFITAISNHCYMRTDEKEHICCVLTIGNVWRDFMCFMRLHIHGDLQSSAFLSYPRIPSDLFHQIPFFPAVHSFFSYVKVHTMLQKYSFLKSIMDQFLVNI